MLLRSRNIFKLIYANNNGKVIYYFKKNKQQSTETTMFNTNDINIPKQKKHSFTQQSVISQIHNLKQFLEINYKKQPSTINDQQIYPVIERLQQSIPKLNCQEMIEILETVSDFYRYHHQFNKQYLTQFLKFLHYRIKQLILKSQPPLSFDKIIPLYYLFLKIRNNTSISKQVMSYSFNRLIPDGKIEEVSKENLLIMKNIMRIFIIYGNKIKRTNKEQTLETINNLYENQKLPVINETLEIINQNVINLSQLQVWYYGYLEQVYQKVLSQKNIIDHISLLKSILDFQRYFKALWGEIRMHTSYIVKICKIYENMLQILTQKNLQPLSPSDINYFLKTLCDVVKYKTVEIDQINKAIKAMKLKYQTLDNSQLVAQSFDSIRTQLNKDLQNNYQQTLENNFLLLSCLLPVFQSTFCQNSKRVASMYKLFLEFLTYSVAHQKDIIQYIRFLEFIVHTKKYLQPAQLKEFISILKALQVSITKNIIAKKYVIYEVIRFRIILKNMNLQQKGQNLILKQYLIFKKQNSARVFQNLSRTLLVQQNLPEIVQICRDTMSKKMTKGISQDQLDTQTWAIIISSIRTLEMILFWRPYIKKMAKSHKFLGYINASLSQQRFILYSQHIQLIAEIYLQCKYRDCYFRNSIEKFLKFSTNTRIIKQLWVKSIHSIKHIYIAHYMFETYNNLKSIQILPLYETPSKCIFFLNNQISLTNSFLYQREIAYILTLYIQHIVQYRKNKEFVIESMMRDCLLWMKSNNTIQILIQQCMSSPSLMANMKNMITTILNDHTINIFDYFALQQLIKKYSLQSTVEIKNYPSNSQETLRIEKLIGQKLSGEELQKEFTIDQIFNCIVRDIKSVNYQYLCNRLAHYFSQDKSESLSIQAVGILARQISRKNQGEYLEQQLRLMKAILDYNYHIYDTNYLSFQGLYTLMQLHIITKTPLSTNFPIEKLLKQNKFVIIQLAHFLNELSIKISQDYVGQLYKYLIQSRLFQYYLIINNKQIQQIGCKKIAYLFRLLLVNNKKQHFIKIVEIMIKELKKIPKDQLELFSKQIAVDIYAARSMSDVQIDDIAHFFQSCLKNQCIKQTIENKFSTLSQQQRQYQKHHQEYKLVPIELRIEIQQNSYIISLFENDNKQLVILKSKVDLWNNDTPNNQNYLLSVLISNKTRRPVKFMTV